MADVKFDERFSPAEATRGSWVPLDSSTIAGGLPSGSRGRYAQLSYLVGSEPGALNLSLSGGDVILPVSSVSVTEIVPDSTIYANVTMAPLSISAISFFPTITLLEVFNTDSTSLVYLGYNDVPIESLSAQGLPILAETFYSNKREADTVYICNVDASPIDVRVIGHYKG
jgi:hypothetical protein